MARPCGHFARPGRPFVLVCGRLRETRSPLTSKGGPLPRPQTREVFQSALLVNHEALEPEPSVIEPERSGLPVNLEELEPPPPANKVRPETVVDGSSLAPPCGAHRRLFGTLVGLVDEGLLDPVALQRPIHLEASDSPQRRDTSQLDLAGEVSVWTLDGYTHNYVSPCADCQHDGHLLQGKPKRRLRRPLVLLAPADPHRRCPDASRPHGRGPVRAESVTKRGHGRAVASTTVCRAPSASMRIWLRSESAPGDVAGRDERARPALVDSRGDEPRHLGPRGAGRRHRVPCELRWLDQQQPEQGCWGQ